MDKSRKKDVLKLVIKNGPAVVSLMKAYNNADRDENIAVEFDIQRGYSPGKTYERLNIQNLKIDEMKSIHCEPYNYYATGSCEAQFRGMTGEFVLADFVMFYDSVQKEGYIEFQDIPTSYLYGF